MSCPWSPPRGRSVTARTVFSLPAGPRRAQRSRTLLVIHRTCPSGKSGGSLGEFGPGQMVKEFNDVVFTTGKVGKVEDVMLERNYQGHGAVTGVTAGSGHHVQFLSLQCVAWCCSAGHRPAQLCPWPVCLRQTSILLACG